MNKSIFKRLTFLVTGAFVAAVGVLCLGIGLFWFNFIVPSILSGEKVRAEMVLVGLTEKLEPALKAGSISRIEDVMVRSLMMKDPSTGENLILGINVETINGATLTKYSRQPVEISGPFAFSAPLYSSATQEVLGEVTFQYNPHFYEILVEGALIKLFWLLGMMAGVIFILQRVLLHLLRPLSDLNRKLGGVDFSQTASPPTIKGWMVSEINDVVQSVSDLFKRLEITRESEINAQKELVRAQSVSKTGNWVWDIVTNDLYWSDEVYRIFGLKPQQFDASYEAFLDVVHPEDRDALEKAVAKAVA
ncbi:MAG: PAS domain-containing protein, partial [Nitrospinota bacterium]|nr:PAS domain-containing protein [Nitrospinota bacterium]